MSTGPLRIAVLLSGSGTSLENLCERIDAGDLDAEVCAVIASKAKAGGLERARRRGIPAFAVPRREHPDVGAFNDALHALLERHAPDLVALLGFLSPFETRGQYDGRTLNVHPALIPAFCGQGMYGRRVHEAVLEAGVKLTGATVHFVDAEYDHGPIILQEAVAVRDNDTAESLAERVQAAERRIVPEAIRLFAESKLTIEGQRVRIKE
ncbi:MAG: phosphoribosylglycinamide formyltransferase [Myxococcota bacterium]|jgi:phosphoribosylglycinamide formyltransferase-1|nr:phosphoribosylglycinamide formyltransferase [Deltaproteobacteria bacterium]MCP4244882.1 phosphoribosylglycinamide formyltransferase [bacterium]MDP6074839.1 phosphoribosylglycinamide formyltransferase [Myxococcota bacterium]MDP6243985.1 phosphoribosylglycinamide formyltransferase [Myxococcota bacterium]MDP7075780.1 phosphoribosylglycinamide formyltransferase [Myxococcota bacterium]